MLVKTMNVRESRIDKQHFIGSLQASISHHQKSATSRTRRR
jgi:hypothetical protein